MLRLSSLPHCYMSVAITQSDMHLHINFIAETESRQLTCSPSSCSPMLHNWATGIESQAFQTEELGENMGSGEQVGCGCGWIEACMWELGGKEWVDGYLSYQEADELMGLFVC